LGGRAAEEVIFGKISTGAANDLTKATDIVKRMITQYGMSEKFKNVVLSETHAPFLGEQAAPGVAREYAESTQTYVDEETARLLGQSYERALGLLKRNEPTLRAIAKKLIEVETLDEKMFEAMVSGSPAAQDDRPGHH
jgi:cell division protease FtsH